MSSARELLAIFEQQEKDNQIGFKVLQAVKELMERYHLPAVTIPRAGKKKGRQAKRRSCSGVVDLETVVPQSSLS